MKQLFKGLSRLRGKRIFHPFGVGFEARLTPLGEPSGAVAFEREAEALVRLSRSFGLPEALPDPCGLAFRIPDAHGPGRHQDLLLVTSAGPPGARHTLMPSRGFADRPYSSVLPYELAGETVLLGARALAPAPGPKLEDLDRGGRAELDFEIVAAGIRGEWRPLARLALGGKLPSQQTELLDLDPTNTGGGLELVGLLNRLRAPAYGGSQEGRHAAYSAGS
ncbi:MAG TPA: hypothetical protein VFY69_02025 [Solirubrobacterales bacterium]|nr:hypothetical protein [Solirubrobacterales bacterium]